MQRTIELSASAEALLRRLKQASEEGDAHLDAVVSLVPAQADPSADAVLRLGDKTYSIVFKSPRSNRRIIRSRDQVMGGDACIRDTRIPVWMLADYRNAGFTDAKILEEFPSLTKSDLRAAWKFQRTNPERIQMERMRHQETD